MGNRNRRSFLQGLTAGAFGSLVGGMALLYLLGRSEVLTFSGERIPDLGEWLEWAYLNLGSSIPVFALLLLVFAFSLRQLRVGLAKQHPLNEVAQLDHLTDIWTTLFFGVGVIWTAIGMRSALITALGDTDATIQLGAFAILKRMVDGGILLALSTTIFGGIGGYLMRVYKAVTVGTELQRFYEHAAREDTTDMRNTLSRIERHLQRKEQRNPFTEVAVDD